MQVYVEKEHCTGCQHCKDVCPVAVFEMKPRKINGAINPDVNTDKAPPEHQWTGKVDQASYNKWINVQDGHRHFADDNDGTSGGISVAVNGEACILCQACLIECEGEDIVITDDSGNVYRAIYK
ncbi:MAG: 4Fe-4S dicluster domain-containing protein [Candidatus Micrarchaeaceae archaeon]